VSELVAGPLADFATPAFERGTGRPSKYLLADGTRVPSNTTIGGRFADKSNLIYWAFNRGKDGFDELYDKEALSVGSLVHGTIEAELNGESAPLIPREYAEQVSKAVVAWHEWFAHTKLDLIATEIPLISERHRFGGTLDTIVRDQKGRLAIGDWKSSKAVYSDYLVQLAGYRILWNENRPEPITGGFHLVRFSKEHGDMEHRHYPELDEAERLFLLFRDAYEVDKTLKKRAR
jgi:hypothetical protein